MEMRGQLPELLITHIVAGFLPGCAATAVAALAVTRPLHRSSAVNMPWESPRHAVRLRFSVVVSWAAELQLAGKTAKNSARCLADATCCLDLGLTDKWQEFMILQAVVQREREEPKSPTPTMMEIEGLLLQRTSDEARSWNRDRWRPGRTKEPWMRQRCSTCETAALF